METRDELLRAAARVYALHGYRGSTTRRIADEAGVNEITIFRQFGSKDALIHEAIACSGHADSAAGIPAAPALPEIPVDPFAELVSWATQARAHIIARRSLLRRCMSEREEHPQLIASANQGPLRAARELKAYLHRLQDHGMIEGPVDAGAAAAMFMGTLFSDTMGRDVMPDVYPSTPSRAIEQYTTLLLRAIGARVGHGATGATARVSQHK